jgi:hypothetical protein
MHDMLASRNLDDLTVKGPGYDASGTHAKCEIYCYELFIIELLEIPASPSLIDN